MSVSKFSVPLSIFWIEKACSTGCFNCSGVKQNKSLDKLLYIYKFEFSVGCIANWKEMVWKDGKVFVEDYNGFCELVVYEGESEEWADGNWHHEFEDPEILEELKKGVKILKTAAIYAQRIDWLLSGDDGEESFKERLKEELDELESKPLIDYDYWKKIMEEDDRD